MTGPILIAGGYGIVGLQLAQLIRKRNPELEIILAGRSLEKAQAAADALGNARAAHLDVSNDQPLEQISEPLGAVLAVVNDPHNHLMHHAIKRTVPYVDITRWTERLKEAKAIAQKLQPRSSVTLSSSWMAGVSAIVAMKACEQLSKVDDIQTSILFRLNDKAGPDSIEYVDRLAIPFRIKDKGEWREVKPFTGPKEIQFPSGDKAVTYLFDEPSQETLVALTGAQSVSSRIGYDDPATGKFMAILVKSGVWKLISGAFFDRFRRSLLYKPGAGASHEIVITVTGKDAKGIATQATATVIDPESQTHLTAVGAYIQLCAATGLEDQMKRQPGIHYPEKGMDLDFAVRVMEEEEVTVQLSRTEI